MSAAFVEEVQNLEGIDETLPIRVINHTIQLDGMALPSPVWRGPAICRFMRKCSP